MKIRSITLHNVRRFAGETAQLTGIADGITTITEPNETGKSTFFDALHALFFLAHGSSTAEVRSLRPYSGGAVEIAAEIETDQGLFRVAKSFLSGKSAVITDVASGKIIAQAGEAEAWIAHTIGTDMAGPAGLLWVRQGISGFGPDGSGAAEKRERERLREERQSLMSSVAGQIDSVTGGRRMDMIMKMVESDLDALATKTLNPKTSGEWGKATKLVDELAQKEASLQEQVISLEQALRERSSIRAKLDDPKTAAAETARAKSLESLAEKLDVARQHSRLIESALQELKLAKLTLKTIDDQIATKAAQAQRRAQLNAEVTQAQTRFDEARQTSEGAESTFEAAHIAYQAAQSALSTARVAEQARQKQADRANAIKQCKEITDLLTRVAGFEDKLKQARDVLRGIVITRKDLDQMEKMAQRITSLTELRNAGATSLRVRYDGSARITHAAGALPDDTPVPIHTATDLTLPGIGVMQISPPRGSGAEETPEQLSLQLDQELVRLGVADLAAARLAIASREAAKRDEDAAKGALGALVPEGTDAPRRALAELQLIAQAELGEPPQDALSIAEAEAAEASARATLEAARQDQTRLAKTHLEAKTTLRLKQESLAGLVAESDEQAADLSAPRAVAATQVEQAKAAHDGLCAAAPDIETLEADQQRLASARDNAKAERARLSDRLNELNGSISTRAEDGVESRLAEVRGAREKAQDRADRYAFEVKALAELRTQLEQARSAARDAYFGPVIQELRPLIAMLHEGAELEMDPDTMLPNKIKRDGVEDDFDMLSGGAAEQIAILTRLAFARLYAKQGRQVPVILDDALVFSDDARIERMFTALTKISKDQQIIVFSCRNRAFEDLGGHRPKIEIIAK